MKVRALQVVTLGPGTVLALSERQAARRAGQLAAEGGGRYRALAPVCFKAGEEFGVEAGLPKALAVLVDVEGVTADARPAVRKAPARPAPKPAATTVDPALLDIG